MRNYEQRCPLSPRSKKRPLVSSVIANFFMEEKKYNTLADVLAVFDVVGKHFEYHDYVGALCALPDDERIKPESRHEWTAFMLQPNDQDCTFGGYFGPQWTQVDKQGTPYYTPAKEDISPEAVLYWEQRYKVAANALMRMRYAALVWDFKRRICNANYEADLYRTYVDAMLEVADSDLSSHPVVTTLVLERLFSIAKSNPVDLIKTKDALRAFETRHASDSSVRCWACQFLLMQNNKRCFTQDEIDALITSHEARLQRLQQPNANGKIDVWTLDSQANLLADYYNRCQQRDELRRVLKVAELAHMQSFTPSNPLQRMGILEQLHHKYVHYGLHDEANALLTEIQEAGTLASQTLQKHGYEYTIPQEVFDQADALFGTKAISDKERWQNFVFQFIPSKDNAEKSLAEVAKQAPLYYMTGTNLMDYKGRPMSIIGSYEQDPEGNLVMHITEHLNFDTPFLGIAIRKMRDVGLMTTDRIMSDIIEPCPLYDDFTYAVIRQALDFLFGDMPVVACHLLVPQIEAAIRNLVENEGISVIKQQKHVEKGFQLITLDELLSKEPVKQVFSPDGAMYLRLVLTDQRSLNIRNDLCHGILPPNNFHSGVAARLLHVLVMIGMVRIKE